ncbi:hypothetical protein FHT86_007520 [Rhizobium sp. BK313]|uniref:BPL-N domain-containing protein n=1 Tax=Rhizobium sp. BK313 TaxID=2587081 RepID=UPI0010D703FB|nr:BPL-N domain-containing protein [Rhizobium sp. BK313]MBB3459188.1 hypothetical protein [Rhizobium sp. BK313]
MTCLELGDPGAFAGIPLVLVNRCRAHGLSGADTATGFSLDARAEVAAGRLGLATRSGVGELGAFAAPRVAIYSGKAIGYPYWAYYAHALLSIGLTFAPLSATEVASGSLERFDLLVMPGGFATWGLDRAEGLQGVDAAIRSFIERGGAMIGSCGGAFYASEGRPGWLGAIDATPKFTQEYLLTGAAVLGISITDRLLNKGLPEAIELPYYHGPIYSNADRTAATLGHFRNYVEESRLFIDNPLDRGLFDREIKQAPAILVAGAGKGKILAFSPHPEMGEFLRKGITFETYVRHFLPIRGHKVMDETLKFFMKEDCAGFRLIYNAIAYLGLFDAKATSLPANGLETADAVELLQVLANVDAAIHAMFDHLEKQAKAETAGMQTLLAAEFGRTRREWSDVLGGLRAECQGGPIDRALVHGLTTALTDAAKSLQSPLRLAENLVLTELPIRLSAAALRLIRCDRALETSL